MLGLNLLSFTSASQSAGIAGVHHHSPPASVCVLRNLTLPQPYPVAAVIPTMPFGRKCISHFPVTETQYLTPTL